MQQMGPIIFGYGSLLWDYSLPYVIRRTPVVLHDFRRSLCFLSWSYRGTREKPGLILGLDAHQGSSCAGQALHIAAADEEAALQHFDEREQINGVYRRQLVTLEQPDGQTLQAHAYISRRDHPQYCGDTLSTAMAAEIVASGVGTRGTALEYLANTVEALRTAEVRDPALERVLAAATEVARQKEDEKLS